MTVMTQSLSRPHAALMPAMLALALGVGLIVIGGMAGSTVLHDAAHDARHALAFPCH